MAHLPAFLAALVVLIYAALTVDAQNKCSKGQQPPQSEANMLRYVSVTMLILSILAVLYTGWHLFAPESHKAEVMKYF